MRYESHTADPGGEFARALCSNCHANRSYTEISTCERLTVRNWDAKYNTTPTLMDLEMRDMNGEAMVAILGEFREAKIIILTTYASDVQGAMNPGARACLP